MRNMKWMPYEEYHQLRRRNDYAMRIMLMKEERKKKKILKLVCEIVEIKIMMLYILNCTLSCKCLMIIEIYMNEVFTC